MRSASKRVYTAALVLFAALIVSGCQNEKQRVYPVSGKITFTDGSPAQFGIIEFRQVSTEPIIARGSIKKDGTFHVRASGGRNGLTAGEHQAIIIQVVGTHRTETVHHHHGLVVDDKYKSYKTSGLKVEVSADSDNHFKIVVESK